MENEEKSILRSVEYLERGELLTAYVRVWEKTNGRAVLGGTGYPETGNQREPYDFRLHTFDFPAAQLRALGAFDVTLARRLKRPSEFFAGDETVLDLHIAFDPGAVISFGQALNRSVRGMKKEKLCASGGANGFEWKNELYRTPEGAPVEVFTAFADPRLTSVYAGTPGAEPEFRPDFIQTVMDEALAKEARTGRKVLCATNADFFDMFGDGHPSGLCVSGGTVVANPESGNAFFGITEDGEPVISTPREFDISRLREAVGGREVIVKDGRIGATAPLESFGDTPHPRTAFGIDGRGRVILMVVDGRRPAWSNGASLTELAMLMLENGAVTAMNTDGGGSSTFIVRKEDGLEMINHPADLERPMEDLIRPLFDSLIVTEKPER
jgi:hypothetical protein